MCENEEGIHFCDCYTVNDLSFPSFGFQIGEQKFYMEPKDYLLKHSNGKCSLQIFNGLTSDSWILGTNFLRAYYSIFDMDNRRIGFGDPNYLRDG